MKKIFVISIIILISVLDLKAQEGTDKQKKAKGRTFIGVEFGRTYFRDEVSDPGGKFTSSQFNTPTFGIFIEHELTPKFSIESGIAVRNFRNSLRSDCSVYTTENSVIQIPLRFNYTLWEKGRFKLKAYAGVNTSFQSAGDSGIQTGSELSYNYLTDGPDLLFTPEIGLKLDYQVNDRIKLGVFASYVMSPRDLNQTIINYSVEGNAPLQAISRNPGSYFQAGFRVSYLLR